MSRSPLLLGNKSACQLDSLSIRILRGEKWCRRLDNPVANQHPPALLLPRLPVFVSGLHGCQRNVRESGNTVRLRLATIIQLREEGTTKGERKLRNNEDRRNVSPSFTRHREAPGGCIVDFF
ncbi:hypothetical protein JZ751_008114 [Albula glossodonta]|uniref:Uncharacterized protein n=1 Tax=Albula glossodonta TaxID=121402 RepID=A0A8T2P1T5_9TELE|nr:hypothetical protein JZ751_008114 [Albula glossodonta]